MAVGDFSRALFFTSYKLNINSTLPPTPPSTYYEFKVATMSFLVSCGVFLFFFFGPSLFDSPHREEKTNKNLLNDESWAKTKPQKSSGKLNKNRRLNETEQTREIARKKTFIDSHLILYTTVVWLGTYCLSKVSHCNQTCWGDSVNGWKCVHYLGMATVSILNNSRCRWKCRRRLFGCHLFSGHT